MRQLNMKESNPKWQQYFIITIASYPDWRSKIIHFDIFKRFEQL